MDNERRGENKVVISEGHIQDPLGRYFARRLRRLVTLKHLSLTPSDQGLVEHALFSTQWDMARMGLRLHAQQILNTPPE